VELVVSFVVVIVGSSEKALVAVGLVAVSCWVGVEAVVTALSQIG
jgi:hypothetical protein